MANPPIHLTHHHPLIRVLLACTENSLLDRLRALHNVLSLPVRLIPALQAYFPLDELFRRPLPCLLCPIQHHAQLYSTSPVWLPFLLLPTCRAFQRLRCLISYTFATSPRFFYMPLRLFVHSTSTAYLPIQRPLLHHRLDIYYPRSSPRCFSRPISLTHLWAAQHFSPSGL